MGKYSEYGEKLDSLARERFSEYEKAKENYDKARKARSNYVIDGRATLEEKLKAQRLELEVQTADAKLTEVKRSYTDLQRQIPKIREELYQKVKADLMINPDDLDPNVVSILNSGICKADEIADLYDKAKNPTMKRYIANFAKGHADDRMEMNDRQILNKIAFDSQGVTDPDQTVTMQNFDSITNVLNRCIKNDAMIGHWGEFTEEAISEM